jgi:hypothetical protein
MDLDQTNKKRRKAKIGDGKPKGLASSLNEHPAVQSCTGILAQGTLVHRVFVCFSCCRASAIVSNHEPLENCKYHVYMPKLHPDTSTTTQNKPSCALTPRSTNKNQAYSMFNYMCEASTAHIILIHTIKNIN